MNYDLVTIPGDGIGPDVVREALAVLEAVSRRSGHAFSVTEHQAGGCAIDATGHPLPEATLAAAKAADAVLLGAVGGPRWETLPGNLRPERALLGLRSGMGVYANLRPAALLPQLRDACPLKDEIVQGGFDLLIVRELTGGLYFGDRGRDRDGSGAWDTEYYSIPEIERVLRAGYRAALLRRRKLCVVDKANVLESSRLWREVAARISKEYPDVATSYLYVDNCAMQLILDPGQFDVIVTSNLFGDILSDEASVLTGSIGMLASASLGDPGPDGSGRIPGLYEPIHGSAPDIAGKDIANPLATILSVALMLRHSFGLEAEARLVEEAVAGVLDSGFRTKDIAGRRTDSPGSIPRTILGTRAMGAKVVEFIDHHPPQGR